MQRLIASVSYSQLANDYEYCSGLIELDTFVSENESTNRGAYDREETSI